MRRAVLASLLGLVLAAAASGAPEQTRDISIEGMRAEKRVALVIGNAAYPTSPLRNPVNDARAMARVLRELGFDVLAWENASQKETQRAILQFGERLRDGGVGVFYYAGHGLQVAGRNYIVPVNAVIYAEAEVEVESVDVASVLARMESANNRLNIVVLDACRDNPFGRSFRSSGRGLAAIDAPSGTLIAYATAPGRLARDGDGANGLYTAELLKAIREPSLSLEGVFKRVRGAVRQATRGEQVPWEASSVEGEFYFKLGAAPARPAAPEPIAGAPPPASSPTKELVREFGSLAIRGSLAGIEIWLDDRKLGATERGTALVINDLAAGTYRLKATKSGYKDWEREVHVVANQRAAVTIDVEALGRERPRPQIAVVTPQPQRELFRTIGEIVEIYPQYGYVVFRMTGGDFTGTKVFARSSGGDLLEMQVERRRGALISATVPRGIGELSIGVAVILQSD